MSDEYIPANASTPPLESRPDEDIPSSMDAPMATLINTKLTLDSSTPPLTITAENDAPGISSSASSMLRVLLPSLTNLDALLESVWVKQDMLNEVLNRLSAELEQFDELILPPGITSQNISKGGSGTTDKSHPVSAGQQAARRLKETRAKIITINSILKKVRARLDNVSMLAQAKILQQQQEHSFTSAKQ
ncbi:hypothetical protein COEREDRAFT_83355 [Coemansia reversa NRRL 1564]|uniref:Biogenesis of lysosome-related organelles complex 1 subunit 7 n=1 Tax=Coemansia reversa (strain ATCC 12441 / NRRL 1564) TaxID=763665 RepID=A0A2G5B3U4_COERN|nr:hypothetical protein COEREDRAFT_83355 [Coemansia reversa NRRL 1564]|eukprot:PIA13661.1 hypothetical protein COEREDRAFT_83355 [Coemansia reversa NRRL 1564]